jgi:hypothetical protein
MKTWKHGSFWAVLVIFGIAFTLTACDPDESDEPRNQNTLISGLFGVATVIGYLSDAQVTKVKGALNAGYNYINDNPSVQNKIKTYFMNNAVIIVVQTTTEYAIYKTVSGEHIIYFNVAALGGALTAERAYQAMSDRMNNIDW